MSETDLGHCDYCDTDRPAAELYEGGPYRRCKDAAGCALRAQYAGTGTLPDLASPETVASSPAPPGTACTVCGASASAADLYERSAGQWFCRNRGDCDRTGAMDMAAVREDFTDLVITAAQMMHMQSAAPPQVPAERPPPDQATLNAQAWQDAMSRKR